MQIKLNENIKKYRKSMNLTRKNWQRPLELRLELYQNGKAAVMCRIF